jgi:hypothetical protein
MNRLFVSSLKSLRGKNRLPLAARLDRIVNDGIVAVDGCYLLRTEAEQNTHANMSGFSDRTGYECFINHIHIDDYVSDDLVNQSIRYASKVLHKWNEQKFEGDLVSVVVLNKNLDSDGATVRFYHKRENEPSWLSDDLDGTDDAILEILSSDVAFFDLF